MRVDPEDVKTVCAVVLARDAQARIFLHGSRAHDDLKGGDLDLLVISAHLNFTKKLDILVELQERLGEQKIDLTVRRPGSEQSDPFVRSVLRGAICLAGC